jgi:hypothetical protein
MARGRDTVTAEPTGDRPPVAGELSRSTHRRRWLVTFVLLVAFASAWSLVTPPGGGPDESAHAIRAAALVDGQLRGEPYPPIGGGARLVEAPASLDGLDPVCFAFQPGISAECRPSYDGPDGDKEMVTNAGVSPPAYYALVGLPLRLFPSLDGVYLARLISGVIAAALVATAIQLAVAARSRFLVAGLAVAWTPIAAFLAGVINPSALEISSALLVWTAGLFLVRPVALPAWLRGRVVWHFAAASALFVVSRQLSPIFLACIVAVLAVAAPWPRLRELVVDRRVWIAAGVVAVATLFSAWYLVAFPVGEDTTTAATAVGGRQALSTPLGYFGTLYQQLIGIFGWLDTRPPLVVLLAWTIAIGVLAVLGAALGTRRLVVALGLTGAASVLLLWLLQASQMEAHGLIFQGRYILPLAAGVVLVAGRAVDELDGEMLPRLARVVPIVLGLTVVGHLVSIWFAARRFAVGVGGPVFFVREGWTPGVSLVLPLAVAAVAVPALAWGMARWPAAVVPAGAASPPADPASDGPAAAGDAPASAGAPAAPEVEGRPSSPVGS